MSDAGTSAAGAQKAEKMTLLQWTVAFHRYAIAAACAPVDGAKGHCIWDYESSMAHMDVVLQVLCRFAIAFALCFQPCLAQIAAGARNQKRQVWLGIIYDRIARKSWAERTAANEAV